MKVLLLNGSPNKNGSTNKALEIISDKLNENGIETSIFWIGNKSVSGCIGCGTCKNTNQCFINDKVNEFLALAKSYDGFIFGSSVHFSSPTGFIIPFLDRVFYGPKKNVFRLKPFSSVVCSRRGGSSSSLDILNKYASFAEMIVVSSNYWNMIYGSNKDDITKDLEGVQTLNVLANNMTYILKLIENGNKNKIIKPQVEDKIYTNFNQKI